MTATRATDDEAQEVAGYALVRRLGGGMDDVFEAVERATGARVALKLPRAGSDGVAWARFDRGVRLARRLDHPRVVRVLAAGHDDGRRPWMTMELLAGETLEARMRREALSPREAVAVARQVCEALDHAHARGVIHRDVKPHNVWLRASPDGALDACLLDFGVARAPDEVAVTDGPEAVGTVAYMAPEQVRGGAEPDVRCDLWSLGVTLDECLAGRHPFREANLAATLYALLTREPPDLRARRADVPTGIAELVRALLARDASARPESAREVITRLDAIEWDHAAERESVTGLERDRWLGAVAEACDHAESRAEVWEVVRRALAREMAAAPSVSPFVGRELELDLLFDALARAERDRGPTVTVILGGDAMGRTRLFEEALALAPERAPGAVVIVGRGAAEHARAPFAALDAAFGAPLSPEPVPPEPQAAIDRARARLYAEVSQRAERGPVVVALDDAQHLDAPSRAALEWLVARGDDVPLALWLFAHDEGRESLAGLSPAQVTRELAPLDPTSARRLLREALPDAPARDVETLVERADGHPFVLEELARMYRDEGGGAEALPVSVEALHQARLYRVGRAARGVLKRAAVFGRTAWIEGVAALGADVTAVPALRRGGLVALKARSRLAGCREFVTHGGSLLDVAYALWPESRRAELHCLAARWLASQDGALPFELARHWDTAHEARPAAEAYARAAEVSARAGDAATVRACVERVLALGADDSLRWRALVAQDEALQIDGAPAARAAGLDALEALAPRVGLGAMAEAAWRRCYHARITRDRAGALHHGALAIDLGERRHAALAHMELALLAANEGRSAEAIEHAGRAAELAGEDPVVRARAAATRGYVLSEAGDAARACELMEDAARRYGELGDVRREAIQRGNAGFLRLRLGRFDAARALLDAAVEGSARVGNKVTLAVGRQNRATLLRVLGRHAEARRELDLAERLCAEVKFARLADAITAERALLALASGAPREELVACAERARAGAGSKVPQTAASCLAAAVRCLASVGVPDDDLDARVTDALARTDLSPESRLELSLARFARGAVDTAAVRARLDACVRGAGDSRDQAARSVVARLVVPDGCVTD